MGDRRLLEGEDDPGSSNGENSLDERGAELAASSAAADAAFAWTPTTEGETIRISLVGDLDAASASRFGAEASAAVCRAEAVIVDCADLDFLDSAGISALLHLRECANHHQADLELHQVPPMIHRVLAISQLLDILQVREPSEPENAPPQR